MYKEMVFPVLDGTWLAITIDDRHGHEEPPRVSGAYAVLTRPGDDAKDDVMPLFALDLPPDREAAEKARQDARTQREHAQEHHGSTRGHYYLNNAIRYERSAAEFELPALLMPTWVFPLSSDRFLCGYLRRNRPVEFRVIDVGHRLVAAAFSALDIHQAIFGKSESRSRFEQMELEVLKLTEQLIDESNKEGVSEDNLSAMLEQITERSNEVAAARAKLSETNRLFPLCASDDRLLLDLGLQRVLIAYGSSRFRVLGTWDTLKGWPVAARTQEGFVFSVLTEKGRQQQVIHVRGETGEVLARWPIEGDPPITEIAGAFPPSANAAMAIMGGPILFSSTSASEPRALVVPLGVDRYWKIGVSLSPSARFVGMVTLDLDGELIVHDRDRRRHAVMSIPKVVVLNSEDPSLRAVTIPALTEDAVLMSRGGTLIRTAFESLAWEPSDVSIPKPVVRETPLTTLDEALRGGPLAPVADQIRSWYRPSVVLIAREKRRHRFARGISKSGGIPELARGASWPRCQGQPMEFLLQINLAEVATLGLAIGLPDRGLLSVFLPSEEQCVSPMFFGDALDTREGCRVIYTPPDAALAPLTPPTASQEGEWSQRIAEMEYEFAAGGLVLPELANDRLTLAGLTRVQRQAYRELASLLNGPGKSSEQWATRLGGYPGLIQNDDLHLHAEANSRGLRKDPSTYALWNDRDFMRSALRWRQLVQLGEDRPDWVWGDAGLMHVMVDDHRWPSAEFDEAWGIGVCR